MLWNTDWENRIGWGKDNEKRGKESDNFKLDGLGNKYKESSQTKGLWADDSI